MVPVSNSADISQIGALCYLAYADMIRCGEEPLCKTWSAGRRSTARKETAVHTMMRTREDRRIGNPQDRTEEQEDCHVFSNFPHGLGSSLLTRNRIHPSAKISIWNPSFSLHLFVASTMYVDSDPWLSMSFETLGSRLHGGVLVTTEEAEVEITNPNHKRLFWPDTLATVPVWFVVTMVGIAAITTIAAVFAR